jgi:hypothetical protein
MADYIYYVTVSGSTFLIDGEAQAELGLKAGLTYRFDVSDASCASQTFKFSTTSDGTHGGGSEYTTNVTVTGTAGSSGAVVDLVVPSSTGTLYYYNGAASGYGGKISYTTDSFVRTQNADAKIPLPGNSDDVWASHLNASLRRLDARMGMMPSTIPSGDTVEIPTGYQTVWAGPITVTGTLTINGTLTIL